MSVFRWSTFLPLFSQAAQSQQFTPSLLCETSCGPAIVWEKKADAPTVYVSAGIHGDEPAGPLALLQLMTEGFFSDGIHWIICPGINPTGLEQGGRTNGAGKDLNRDYLRRETLEITAHAAWLEDRPPPALFLSLHEDCEVENFYLYEINTGADDPVVARSILEAVRPIFLPEPGPLIDDHIPRDAGWIFHEPEPDEPQGWPEAIFLAKYGCRLSFTFETPSKAPLASRIAAHCIAVRTACALRPTRRC